LFGAPVVYKIPTSSTDKKRKKTLMHSFKEIYSELDTRQGITSFSQKIIQSFNGDASELMEETKGKAKKVPQGSV